MCTFSTYYVLLFNFLKFFNYVKLTIMVKLKYFNYEKVPGSWKTVVLEGIIPFCERKNEVHNISKISIAFETRNVKKILRILTLQT